MPGKQDFYDDCSSGFGSTRPTVEQLAEAWCNRCSNTECSRSLGKTKFEQKVETWEDRLFLHTPRMSPSDPRFLPIASQGFHTIELGRVPEIRSAWHDPRDLAEASAPARFSPDVVPAEAEPAPEPVQQAPAVPESPEPPRVQPAAIVAATHPKPPVVDTKPVKAAPRPLNTPDQRGRLLQRPVSAPNPPPAADPWAAPHKSALSPGDTIVKPGAKVRLGGS